MWASKARYQASVSRKLHSVHWIGSTQNDSSGWLASACDDGIVGVSWITREESGEGKNTAATAEGNFFKSHFNLRGHTCEVRLVRWRSQGDRIATCDSWGGIKIWKNRANVLAVDFEFITTVLVRDMQWSCCGYYIAICGEEGHLQVFSGLNGANIFAIQLVAALRFSSQAQFSCCSWNSSGTRIALGTERGEVVDVDTTDDGQTVLTIGVRDGVPVLSTHYFGPAKEITKHTSSREAVAVPTQSLSVYLSSGEVRIFPTICSGQSICVQTRVVNGTSAWNGNGELMVVVGQRSQGSMSTIARFIDSNGNILLTVDNLLPPYPKPETFVHSICWAMNNTRIFLAYGKKLFSIDVSSSLPSLQNLCRQYISNCIRSSQFRSPQSLPLPQREIDALCDTHSSLLPVVVDTSSLEWLFAPLQGSVRLHCVLVSAENDSFILKSEYFGSYIPLMRAEKKMGKLVKTGFVIKSISPFHMLDQQTHSKKLENWATPAESQINGQNEHGSQWSKLLNRLRMPAMQSVMDIPQSGVLASKTSSGMAQDPQKTVLAEVGGNSITNRFKFSTNLPQPCSSSLGNMNIVTYYIHCEPRQMVVSTADRRTRMPLTLRSKKPEWNALYGIFELDFGGRINRDSVKNYQIEHNGEVVFQFGRCSYGDYCLDFQAPFSPVLALCVALASIL